MMKDIFDLLNQVETNFEEYEILEFSQSEKEESTIRVLGKLKERDIQDNSEGHLQFNRSHHLKKYMGVAVLFLICLLSVGGVAYAVTDGFGALFTFISGGAIYETESTEGNTVYSSVTTVVMHDEPGVPLLLEDGRLYFTGDGGKTDITDFISETEPYFIDVVDGEGNTHRFIVGGRPEEECYGYNEMIIDTEGVFRGGAGSCGSKIEGTPEWMKKGSNAVLSETRGIPIELWYSPNIQSICNEAQGLFYSIMMQL